MNKESQETSPDTGLKRMKVLVNQLVERTVTVEVLVSNEDDAKARAVEVAEQLPDFGWGAVRVNENPDYQTYLTNAL